MPGRRLNSEDIARIKTMSEQKYTQAEIADFIGCSVATVRRIQQQNDIPASNRYNGGLISSDASREIPKIEVGSSKNQANRSSCSVIAAEKIVTFVGSGTGFMYGIGTKVDQLKITANNQEDFVIDIKDLVSFGNEILDVAEKILDLQKLPW